MKKISNSIRIGMVRREPPSEKLNEDQSSSIMQGQKLQAKVIQNSSMKDELPDQKHISEFALSNTLPLNDLNDIQSNKEQHSNDLNSHTSHTPSHLQQQKITDLCEIPTKTKLLTTKKILIGVSAAIVIGAIIATTTVLAVVLTTSSGSTTSITSTTTTVTSRTTVTAFWSFDGVSTDLYSVYHGTTQNIPSYSPVGSQTIPYLGYGRALGLNANLTQYVLVSTFMDLSYTSFTIEAWIYSITSTGDRGLFGQCQYSLCSNQCLYFIVRSGRLYIGFTSNDLMGSTVMSINTWYHVAFVYDYQAQQQILYVNGVLFGSTGAGTYYSSSTFATLYIGYSTTSCDTGAINTPFQGSIDEVYIHSRELTQTDVTALANP